MPLLSMTQITKRFPGVVALEGVDFDVEAGEVHALMGENGAGKSTLLKVMTGVYSADEGTIHLAGTPISPTSPQDAVRLGISPVYQEVNLAPNLTVAENICLGREPRGWAGIKWKEVSHRAEHALGRLGLKLDVQKSLSSYPIAIQQMVAIARALDVSAKVLVLDEPTSSLDRDEVEHLFYAVRRLKDEGLGVVFVTHFLDQVYELSDRITVLRNGKKVIADTVGALPQRALISHMLGTEYDIGRAKLQRATALGPDGGSLKLRPPGSEVLLECEGVSRRNAVSEVTMNVSSGEVVGLAGLLGSGRTETVKLLFGADQPDLGKTPHRSIRSAIQRRFGLCPEDRKAEGIFPELSVRENMMLVMQTQLGWFRRISPGKQRKLAQEFIEKLGIATPDSEKPIGQLSGGNQQKVLLARWLLAKPKLLMLDEPTRGIDIGAKFEIMKLVEELRSQGMGFVFVSSELSEVVRSCDRVYVLRDRQMIGECEVSEEMIMATIAGDSS